jgi:outer membrane protein assembly factor BamD
LMKKTAISLTVGKRTLVAAAFVGLLSSCVHKKYETPITKNTQQPDKVLFDKAMGDIEHGRYETARIELNTLMNTYESSEYLAKAKLALADSWFREGGGNGLAQAEAEYKDFELFYPTMEEASEAQYKICMIHYKEMDKADRDVSQALRAEDECRNLMNTYPNSKHAPEAAQLLRNIQEVLGEHEFDVGVFYYKRGASPAAANRLSYVSDQYPLFSGSDQALWDAGEAYLKMGPKFRQNAADAFSRIVRDYPLSARAEDAKHQLTEMEVPVPEASRSAYDREKYDAENYKGPSLFRKSAGFALSSPDLSHAAKSGQPAMQDQAFPIPASVPKVNNTLEATSNGSGGAGTTDIQGGVVQDSNKLDTGKDARDTVSSQTPAAPAATPAPTVDPIPTNHDVELKKARERAEKKAKHSKKSQAHESAAPVSHEAPTEAPPTDSQQPQATPAPSDSQAPVPAQTEAPAPTQAQPAQQ